MGGCVSQICGGSAPPKPSQNAGSAIAGYDWDPEPAPAAAQVKQPEPKPEPEEVVPPRPAPTTPIVIDTLQGAWVNSVGAKISVDGTTVSLNGIPMHAHPINMNEDGTVKSIGRIWQLKGWLPDEKIEWKEAPSMEVAEYARSVVWSKATDENMTKWTAQMAGLGYSGSSKAPLDRGIEGCCPGTCDAKAKIVESVEDQDKAELAILNRLISDYRVPGLTKVPPRSVIPDFSNRGHTGLSVEHVHYLATSFQKNGFIKRVGNEGHDIPVLVRESRTSDLGQKSVENWRQKLSDEPGFPPKEHYENLFNQPHMYTSLGNGHFNQALNLFGNECVSIYNGRQYTVGHDQNLREAVDEGVPAIVLRREIPLRDRETISRLLNSKREFKWDVNEDGTLNILNAQEDMRTCKQFEAMSKVLDAVELNCLVRAELGVTDSHRIGQ